MKIDGIAGDRGMRLLFGTGNRARLSVMDKDHIYESMDLSIVSQPFILTDIPHSNIRKEGFPLDSLSLKLKTGKYCYDLMEEEMEQFAAADSILLFFEKILNCN